ncbi:hypothetical protein AB0P21_15960 [Kribbella sp. NPDC056861]|uniref:TlpA family protein disulfide reductase n=1 Tax=Kribbella sp. NPDC056861 TaxID=3154857 RepID=UPI00343BA1D4
MAVLSTAVVLIGLIALLNLVLTIGVIRRLRAQPPADQHQHAGGLRPAVDVRPTTLEPGERVPGIDAVTIDGIAVQLPFEGRSLIGFFSPSCSTCREQLIPFVVTAERQPAGVRVLAVVAGSDDDTAKAYVDELLAGRSEVLIVREDEDGPVQKAFGIKGFPAFAIVDDGQLGVSDFQVSELQISALKVS